jgi:hypothetical protein
VVGEPFSYLSVVEAVIAGKRGCIAVAGRLSGRVRGRRGGGGPGKPIADGAENGH